VNRRPASGRINLCTGNVLLMPHLLAGAANGKRAVVLAVSEVRGIVERACARRTFWMHARIVILVRLSRFSTLTV